MDDWRISDSMETQEGSSDEDAELCLDEVCCLCSF
jgi:hypothetical protein